MKRHRYAVLAALVLLPFTASCGGGGGAPAPPNNSGGGGTTTPTPNTRAEANPTRVRSGEVSVVQVVDATGTISGSNGNWQQTPARPGGTFNPGISSPRVQWTAPAVTASTQFELKWRGELIISFEVTTPRGRSTVPVTTTVDRSVRVTVDPVNVTPPPDVTNPVVNAGSDIVATDNDNDGSEVVTINGSVTDNVGVVSSQWSEGGNVLSTTATLNHAFAIGSHTLTLMATDAAGNSGSDTVTVTVNPAPVPDPVANAGADITVTDSDNSGSETVQLDGSASTNAVSYSWSEGGNTLGTGATLSRSFAVGTHTVVLTVANSIGVQRTDTVAITVNAGQPQMTTRQFLQQYATENGHVVRWGTKAAGAYQGPFGSTVKVRVAPSAAQYLQVIRQGCQLWTDSVGIQFDVQLTPDEAPEFRRGIVLVTGHFTENPGTTADCVRSETADSPSGVSWTSRIRLFDTFRNESTSFQAGDVSHELWHTLVSMQEGSDGVQDAPLVFPSWERVAITALYRDYEAGDIL